MEIFEYVKEKIFFKKKNQNPYHGWEKKLFHINNVHFLS